MVISSFVRCPQAIHKFGTSFGRVMEKVIVVLTCYFSLQSELNYICLLIKYVSECCFMV
jgi:hypothetical protein